MGLHNLKMKILNIFVFIMNVIFTCFVDHNNNFCYSISCITNENKEVSSIVTQNPTKSTLFASDDSSSCDDPGKSAHKTQLVKKSTVSAVHSKKYERNKRQKGYQIILNILTLFYYFFLFTDFINLCLTQV